MPLKISGELADSPATSNAPVPFKIEVQDSGIIITIPQDGKGGCSVAEVYLEHYAGKINLYAWDKNHFLNADDPVCSVVLLSDSNDRKMP